MRIVHSLLVSLSALPLLLSACGDDHDEDAEPFDTLQACYDEHHEEESLPASQAIVVCCVDHPIADRHPSCGDTKADCLTHVSTELGDSASAAEVEAACADYIDKK